jgi:hypothetical protein
MRLVPICAAALILCAAAAAAPPRAGTLVPGRSLGGIRLGDSAARVTRILGSSHGVCRGCAIPTWYFTYRPFTRRGLAVELVGGHVSGIYTLWKPPGWRARGGLQVGAVQAQVTALGGGALVPIACAGYDAMVRDTRNARTAYYIVDEKLWGFGLVRPHASPCR